MTKRDTQVNRSAELWGHDRGALLRAEKERRGVPEQRLVFVGAHNVAEYWWCAIRANRRSRERELVFFEQYLWLRLEMAQALGQLSRVPSTPPELLAAAAAPLDLSAVEVWVEKRGWPPSIGRPPAAPTRHTLSMDMEPAEVEAVVAHEWPTFSWTFDWSSYVVIARPDGLSRDVVHEVKVTRIAYLAQYVRPVAETQADLYGLFFQRTKKRVTVVVRDKPFPIERPVDTRRARDTLQRFSATEFGIYPRPPQPPKCRSCEYRKDCAFRARDFAKVD